MLSLFLRGIRKMASVSGIVANSIKTKLQTALQTKHLDVINESYMHNVPKGAETHFKVVVVSSQFEGLPLIKLYAFGKHFINATLSIQIGNHSGKVGLIDLDLGTYNTLYKTDIPTVKRRHRLVNETLKEELQNGVHALSIVAKTPMQWESSDQIVESSPNCKGGFGK